MKVTLHLNYLISILIIVCESAVNVLEEKASWESWFRISDICVIEIEGDYGYLVEEWIRRCKLGDRIVNDTMCEGPNKFVIPCQGGGEHVVGGDPVLSLIESPWQVFIELDNGADQCGGSLIRHDWILTAAHCFQGGSQIVTRITMGTTSKYGNTADAVNTTAERIICHEDYTSRTWENDICLIKIPWLKSRGIWSIIDISPDYIADNMSFCRVTGWGYVDDMTLPEQLQKGSVEIIDQNICKDWYKQIGDTIPNRTICAGYEAGGIDTCGGDSGGPLECNGLLYGVTSFGPEKCGSARLPGVYTKVADFYEWIEEVISKSLKGYHWSSWAEQCSVTCGEGEMYLRRNCLNEHNDTVDPQNCDGIHYDIDICVLPDCKEYSWSDWKGECNASCGEGSVEMTRECQEKISKKREEPILCGDYPTNIYGKCLHAKECEEYHWEEWKSPCDVTCGVGTEFILRVCFDQKNSEVSPENCGVNSTQIRTCLTPPCKIYEWGEWESTHCGVTCGVSFQTRVRSCFDEDHNKVDNANCPPGLSSERKSCRMPPCKVYRWGPWKKSCSVTCGTGQRRNIRRCLDERNSIVDKEYCKGRDQITRPCKRKACPMGISYNWGPWRNTCSVTCGVGIVTSIRNCLDNNNKVVMSFLCGEQAVGFFDHVTYRRHLIGRNEKENALSRECIIAGAKT
ncbi:uncharacterized protein LOC120331053 [Styela clava]